MLQRFRSILFNPAPSPIRPWDMEYFRHLAAEWNTLDIDPTAPDAIRVAALVQRFNGTDKSGLHRSDLLELEQTLLQRLPTASLIQIAPVLRLRYRDVVGEREYAAYRPTELPPCGTDDPKARATLLDDLRNLISAIHWRYVIAPFGSLTRTSLTLSALGWMLFYTILWGAVILFCDQRLQAPFLPIFITCLFAGILGGFISALRRMQSISDDSDSVIVIQGIAGADFWLWFSPMLGGVFAVVALLFFLSGLIGGTIFPQFEQAPGDLAGHWRFWTTLVPHSHGDYAKLFLWCFIAGFAERLIPDMIDRLIKRADDAQSGTPVPIPTNSPLVGGGGRTRSADDSVPDDPKAPTPGSDEPAPPGQSPDIEEPPPDLPDAAQHAPSDPATAVQVT